MNPWGDTLKPNLTHSTCQNEYFYQPNGSILFPQNVKQFSLLTFLKTKNSFNVKIKTKMEVGNAAEYRIVCLLFIK